ncbi:MAG: hypothetical protein GXD23_13070 [Comamonadaceae bacterium]|jgi:hypothetical protein|nr:hypothetical protein [Comamonadaceae bacterium]
MTDDTETEMALAALLAIARDEAPGLPEDLLRKAFAIQRRHQFDREEQSSASVQDMQSLIDAYVDSQMGAK